MHAYGKSDRQACTVIHNRPAKFPAPAIILSFTPIGILVPHCKQPHVYPQAEAPQDRPVALVSLSSTCRREDRQSASSFALERY